MISLLPRRAQASQPVPGSADWLRLARLARTLSWATLAWMGIEGGVAIGAAVAAGSVALLGFGLDSGIEALASIIVIWRFTGTWLASATAERRAQQLVAVSFFLLAPYIAVEAARALAGGDRAGTSIAGLVLTAGTAVLEPALGVVKRRIGARLGSAATAGEGTQNLLCAYLAIAVFAGLAANTLFGAWWLDKTLRQFSQTLPCALSGTERKSAAHRHGRTPGREARSGVPVRGVVRPYLRQARLRVNGSSAACQTLGA